MTIIAKIEVDEPTFKKLKKEGVEMDFRSYYNPEMKEYYKKNVRWVELTEIIKEAIEERNEIESDIRVELMMDKLGKKI